MKTPDIPLKAKLFRGLADPSRLAVLEALRDGALSVNEVVRRTRLTQPNVSMSARRSARAEVSGAALFTVARVRTAG